MTADMKPVLFAKQRRVGRRLTMDVRDLWRGKRDRGSTWFTRWKVAVGFGRGIHAAPCSTARRRLVPADGARSPSR